MPIQAGSMGTLDCIDDAGQFHARWDDGRRMALIIGVKQFQVVPLEAQTVKFCMPVAADFPRYDN